MIKILGVYLAAIVAWSTTPIGIQMSSVSLHPLTSLYYRLTITALLGIFLVKLFGVRMPWSWVAIRAYAILGFSVGGGLAGAYFGFQHVPSGLGAVIFGLSPIFSALVEKMLIPATRISAMRQLASVIGLLGLITIFLGRNSSVLSYLLPQGAGLGRVDTSVEYQDLLLGGMIILLSMVIFNVGAVMLRKYIAQEKITLNPFAISIGGFSVFSIFIGAIIVIGARWYPELYRGPEQSVIFYKEAAMVLYLAVVGSIIGFCSYNYLLIRLSVQSAAMVTFITPIAALALGVWFNNEVIFSTDYMGAIFVLISIVLYVFGDQIWRVKNRPRAILHGNVQALG